MKLPTINPETVYLHPDQGASVVDAGHAARPGGYQFMLHQMRLYMLGYWREFSSLEYFEIVMDDEEIQYLADKIVENQAELDRHWEED